jgi:hypothetical protein
MDEKAGINNVAGIHSAISAGLLLLLYQLGPPLERELDLCASQTNIDDYSLESWQSVVSNNNVDFAPYVVLLCLPGSRPRARLS